MAEPTEMFEVTILTVFGVGQPWIQQIERNDRSSRSRSQSRTVSPNNYSDMVIPLTRLTRKNVPWNFDEKCKVALQANPLTLYLREPRSNNLNDDILLIINFDRPRLRPSRAQAGGRRPNRSISAV